MGAMQRLAPVLQRLLSDCLGGMQVDCVRSEGNPGYSGKQCLGVFGKLSGMRTSWIPFEGIMPHLSSGLQGWTVACGPAMGVGRYMVVFFLCL